MAAEVAARGRGVDEAGPAHPPGLRQRLDGLFAVDAHAADLGIEIVDWGLGWCEVALVAAPRHANFIGPVHGGVVFSAADVALSVAGNSWGRVSLALSMEVQFLKATAVGQAVRAVATCKSRGRRISSFAVDVEAGGRLVGTMAALNYRTDDWHFGDDAWPPEWRDRF